MTAPIEIDIPHKLGTAQAKTRIAGSFGKLADFVILEKDPHDVDPDTIKTIKVVRTVTGGKTVYPKSS